MADLRDLGKIIAAELRQISGIDLKGLVSTDEQVEWRLKYWADPVAWARDTIRWPVIPNTNEKMFLAPHQQDTLTKLHKHKRVATWGPRGLGKSMCAAIAVLHFVTTRDGYVDWKLPTTAGGYRQIEEYLWPEIHKWARLLRWDKIGRRPWSKRDELMQISLSGETGRAFGAACDNPDLIEGGHASQILCVFDESKAIPDGVFDAVEGMLTQAGIGGREAFLLALSTPGPPVGRFYQICIKREGFTDWEPRPVTIEEAIAAKLVNEEWAKSRAQQWGVSSALFQCHVLGKFADGSKDGVIPAAWVEEAQGRTVKQAEGPEDGGEKIVLGVDVAKGGCFDDQTEILTHEGWKFFADLSGREQVLTLNGDVAEWGPITKIHRYPFDGELNLFESKGGKINFCITDNHRLLVAPAHQARRHGGEWKIAEEMTWRLAEYQDLPSEFLMRRSNGWLGSDPGEFVFESRVAMPNGGERLKRWEFTQLDWFEFLGWFVAEGCVSAPQGVRDMILISQKNGDKRARIESLLERMGLSYYSGKDGPVISNRAIGEHLASYCGIGAANKRVPHYVKEAPAHLIEVFLTTYNAGDGWQRLGQRGGYCSSSRLLIDDVQEMLVKIGRCGRAYRVAEKGSATQIEGREVVRRHEVWAVTETARDRSAYVSKARVRKVPYRGEVHCVSTPLQTIMVRRNGTPMWSGNSNETVIAVRKGWAIVDLVHFQNNDLQEVVRAVIGQAKRHKPEAIVIDSVGVGAGPFDSLREKGYPVVPFHAGETAPERDFSGEIEFVNRRSWAWWRLRELLHPYGGYKISLPEDDTLLTQLVTPTYQRQGNRLMVERKEDIEKKLRKLNPNTTDSLSTDRADAVVMAFADAGSRFEDAYGLLTGAQVAGGAGGPSREEQARLVAQAREEQVAAARAARAEWEAERARVAEERERRARPENVQVEDLLFRNAHKNHDVFREPW